MWAPGGAIDVSHILKVRGLDLSSCRMSFNVFRFPVSFFVWDCKDTVRCWRTGAASCRAAATELFGRKNLEKSTLAGPCFRVPKSAENRLRSKVPPELKIPGCVKDSCAYPRTQF